MVTLRHILSSFTGANIKSCIKISSALWTLPPLYSSASQMHRDYYRGFPKAYHPLLYFREPQYLWHCGPEMTATYLSNPSYHVCYKHPAVLPPVRAPIPPLPERTLAPRYNKPACQAFIR